MNFRHFPTGFLWGAATSAYQIEGAWNVDGKGESIWDRFVCRPYNVLNGDTGDVACDHYHRMPEDVALMKDLGLQSYRFSISWPRVLPEGRAPSTDSGRGPLTGSGRGAVNEKGLDFYDRLVDNLLAAGILPNATLNHWDFPQALQDEGGWPNRDSADWFTDYTRVVFDRLGDRVALWVTHNEPWVIAFLGYGMGIHAPGRCDYSQAFQTAHHLLLAHGKAVQLFRQGGYKGEIGIVLNLSHFEPASAREADQAACRRAYEGNASLFLEPLFKGRYPEMLFDWIGAHRPQVRAEDLDLISQPIDFLGVNYYTTVSVSHAIEGSLLKLQLDPVSAPGWGRTEMGWGVFPSGSTAVLLDVKEKYGNPKTYITENGCAFHDAPDETGFVADGARINFLRAHLHATLDAIDAGANLQGYYVWSLMDNFEWARGYEPRFGLVRVEYETGKRIPKQSARWYGDVIKQNGISL
jgi:beta-glucosidase